MLYRRQKALCGGESDSLPSLEVFPVLSVLSCLTKAIKQQTLLKSRMQRFLTAA